MGMFLSYHTPLGKEYYTAGQIRLIFFWIFPVIVIVIFILIIVFIIIVEAGLFGNKKDNSGLMRLLNIK